MTSKDLNLKLIKNFPEIRDVYLKETSWQDGDETGSHVIYADVFVPFVKAQIDSNNKQNLIKAFNFIEKLLKLNDEYTNEVVAFSVLESLLYDEDVDNSYLIEYAKTNTLNLIKEIMQNIGK